MGSVPKEIKLMEQIARELERWADDKSKQLSALSDGYLSSFPDSFCLQLYEVLEWLQWHKPNLAKSVEEEHNAIRQFIEASKHEYDNGHKPVAGPFLARISADILARKLRHLAQIAREELKNKEKVNSSITGWIFKKTSHLIAVIIFLLAALLTIFHYLGWLEPIRAFIYNILRPK